MKKFTAVLTVLMAAVVMMGSVTAADAATYPLKKISAQEVGVLLETNRPIAIIDVRDTQSFNAGHIPAAESIPTAAMADAAVHSLIPDENKVIVVYGADNAASQAAGQMLCNFGYKNVYYMPTFTEWVGVVEAIVVPK